MKNSKCLKTCRILLAVVLTATMCLGLDSCAGGRRLIRGRETRQVQQLIDNNAPFTTLEAKLSLQQEIGNSVNMQLRLRKDSCLWLSIKPLLGIEMMRVLVTPERCVVVNRLGKQYMDLSLDELGVPDLEWLLPGLINLLSNRLYVPGVAHPTARDFEVSHPSDGILELSCRRGDYTLAYRFGPQQDLEKTLLTHTSADEMVEVNYLDFQSTDFGRFPNRLQLTFNSSSQGKTEIVLNLQRIVFDGQPDFPLSIPAGYQEFQPSDLLNKFNLIQK